jgi:hypothetical protein
MDTMTRRTLFTATAALLTLTAASPLAAQGAAGVDPRFQPWLGCWETVGVTSPRGDAAAAQPTRACLLPSTTEAGSVDVVLLNNRTQLSRSSIPRPGTTRSRQVEDCTGTERAEWTRDEMRLILRAELSCPRGVKRTETGLMSMTEQGQWLQVQHLEVGTNSATTVSRFRFDADSTTPLNASVGGTRSTWALRLAVGGPLNTGQLLDVVSHVPTGLAEAWLLERGDKFDLNARDLTRLADNGMPPRIIDLMVAMAHPEAFVVNPDEAAVRARDMREADPRVASRSGRCGYIDDFCYGPGGMGAWGFGWQYVYGPWPYSRYGLRYGSLYDPYGYGYGGMYYGDRPIVIINEPGGTGSGNRGRAVNGQGYTRSSGSGSSSGSSTGSSSGSTSGTSSAPRSSPPATTTGGSSGGGSTDTGGRTAKTRPPGGG